MEEIIVRLSQTRIQQMDRLRGFADGKERSREQFAEDAVKEYIDTLLNNPERLERGLGKLLT